MQPTRHTPSRFVWVLMAVMLPAASATQAAPELQAPASEQVRPEDAALREFVRQLDADTLQARQQASDQLLAAGSRSIAPLTAALPHASAETTLRGLGILKKLVQQADFDTKHQARVALDQLSRSDDRSLARQSATILRVLEPFARSTVRAPGQMMVGVPGGFRMFQVQMVNGPATRRIVSRESGQIIAITESPQDGIIVSITDRVNNRDQTTTIVARTRGELEAKNPKAAALYQKYKIGAGLGLPGVSRRIAPGMMPPREPLRQFDRPRGVPQNPNP